VDHPPQGRHPLIAEVQRDYAFLLSAYAVEPGAATPGSTR
jgi:hypothetical protein